MVRTILRSLVLLVAGLALIGFAFVATRPVLRDTAVDTVEARVLDQATRFAHDTGGYGEPLRSGEVAPMPGLPYAASLLIRAFGPALWIPRMLVVIAAFLLASIVLAIVQLET